MNFKSFVTASAALVLCQGVGASAVRRWSTAGPSCTDFTPYVYAGCFSDPSSPRALPFSSSDLNTQNMTVEICVAFCKGANPPCPVCSRTPATNQSKATTIAMLGIYHEPWMQDRTTNLLLVSNITGNVSAELPLQGRRLPNRIVTSHAQAIRQKHAGAMISCRFTKTPPSPRTTRPLFPTTSLRDAGPTTVPVAGLLYTSRTNLIRRP
jgi:hypothetical protein